MNVVNYYLDNGRILLTVKNANVIPNVGDEIHLTDARLRYRVTRRVIKFSQGKHPAAPVDIYMRIIS